MRHIPIEGLRLVTGCGIFLLRGYNWSWLVSAVPAEISRREAIGTSAAAAIAAIYATPALAGNIPSGFSAISDSNKNYAFLIPFGWQVGGEYAPSSRAIGFRYRNMPPLLAR
eukprot:1186608-Prorocentrum_minimum.AAC.2